MSSIAECVLGSRPFVWCFWCGVNFNQLNQFAHANCRDGHSYLLEKLNGERCERYTAVKLAFLLRGLL